MFALIIAIFLSVLFITGWVFADRSVTDLINVTPIFGMKNAASASASAVIPEILTADFQVSDSVVCPAGDSCY